MGCDFSYRGTLPDASLQEKVIDFVKQYFKNIDLCIMPDPKETYPTEIHLPLRIREYIPRTEVYEDYSFNFFGIIPDCKNDGISDHCQFIFNRNDSGRLVKLMRLPERFGIEAHHYYRELRQPKQTDDTAPSKPYPYQVVVDHGGYARLGGGLGFALLLTICQLRWWPDLTMGDDYENCDIVDALLRKYGMHRQMEDESLDFDACYNLLMSEYENDFPEPSSDGSRKGDLQAQARWYLDFEERIKPYLRKKQAPELDEGD